MCSWSEFREKQKLVVKRNALPMRVKITQNVSGGSRDEISKMLGRSGL